MLSRPTTLRLIALAAFLIIAGGIGAAWFMTCDSGSCCDHGAAESVAQADPVAKADPAPASRLHINKSKIRLKVPVDAPDYKTFRAPKKRNLAEEPAR